MMQFTNDSSIVDGKGIGDPTEYALLEMFRNIQVLPESYLGKMGFMRMPCEM